MAGKQELLQKLGSLNLEISALKRELTATSSKKKEMYSKLDELKKAFRPLIEAIKELKSKRDEHTKSVKSLKTERESATSVVKKTIQELKSVRQEKDKKSAELGVRRSAASIAAEIERLEFKIETDAMPFEQEKKLNKVIKEKKAELKKAEQLSGSLKKLREYSSQLASSKNVSDAAHKELRLHASVSQKLHEEMLANAKKADEIKAKMNPMQKEIRTLNEHYSETKSKLEKNLKEAGELSKQLGVIKAEEENQRKLEEEKKMKQTENELTEKMKSGKKLTMDDLIRLQKGN